MKKVEIIAPLFILLFCSASWAQGLYGDDQFYDYTGRYASDSTFDQIDSLVAVNSDFKSKIEKLNRVEDYKYLRNYKNSKEGQLSQIDKKLNKYQRKLSDLSYQISSLKSEHKYYKILISEAEAVLKETPFKPNDNLLSRLGLYKYEDKLSQENFESRIKSLKDAQSEKREIIKRDSVKLVKIVSMYNVLIKNKQVVESDIEECIATIDSAIAPEYKNQSFKRQISVAFSVLIGVLIIAFFLIVYLRSDNNISATLLSDGGLQFVTIFVLIIAIILFGVLDILKSNELSAILSGIAGYILGKSGKISLNQNAPKP